MNWFCNEVLHEFGLIPWTIFLVRTLYQIFTEQTATITVRHRTVNIHSGQKNNFSIHFFYFSSYYKLFSVVCCMLSLYFVCFHCSLTILSLTKKVRPTHCTYFFIYGYFYYSLSTSFTESKTCLGVFVDSISFHLNLKE